MKAFKRLFFTLVVVAVSLYSFQACNTEEVDPHDNDTIKDPDPVVVTYQNPLDVPEAGEIADPSAFRYRNRYYLLSTQMYSLNGPGMTVWSSDDLVNWKVYRRIPIMGSVDPILAPELLYHEGTYYLYWSVYPGEVHYAAKYRPDPDDIDPFGVKARYEIFSYNFLELDELNIDGEIFFDKNDLYMFFCGFDGIQFKKLNSLTSAGSSNTLQLFYCAVRNVVIGPGEVGTNGWTEAPGIFFDDGYYYLTYSGVHFMRPDYQIHSARGTTLYNIKPHKENPLIAKFDGEYNGMGNNNFTLGPDLTTKYLTYHVKVGEGIFTGPGGIDRRLMLDRYEVSAELGIVTDAPTLEEVPAPDTIGFENGLTEVPDNMLFNHSGDAAMEAVLDAVEISTGGGEVAELLFTAESGNDFVIEGNARGTDPVAGGDSRYGLTTCDGKIRFAVEMAGAPDSPALL
ncbi:MAG: family 43 glycosylhydrolase, partial [Bacteroidota bacterium]